MKYLSVIFDLDGTLLDTSQGIYSTVEYTLNLLEKEMLVGDAKKQLIGPPMYESFNRVCGLTKDESEKAVDIYRKRYEEVGQFRTVIYPGIIDLLDYLKSLDIRLGVASLKLDEFAKSTIQHFFDEKYFDIVLGSNNMVLRNLKSQLTLDCIKYLNSTPDKSVLIGDSFYDGRGAKEAKVDFIAAIYGFGFNSDESALEWNPVFSGNSPFKILEYFKTI